MDKLQLYLYFIYFFAVSAFILFVVFFIAKKPIVLKIRSIFARKKGMIMVDYIDEKKVNYITFSNVHEKTIRFKKSDGTGMLLGIDPSHIQYDSTYDIMKVKCNPLGSYMILEDEDFEQSFLSPELADQLLMKTAMSPANQDVMNKLIKIILIVAIASVAVSLVIVFLQYDTWQIVSEKLAQYVAPKVI